MLHISTTYSTTTKYIQAINLAIYFKYTYYSIKVSFIIRRFTMSLKRKTSTLPLSDAKKTKPNASITSFFGAPKPKTPASSTSNGSLSVGPTSSGTASSIPDSSPAPAALSEWKKKWVASLTEEQKNLLVLEIESLHETWLKELKDEITSSSFLELKRFLKREHESGQKIFPPAQDVYAWYLSPSPDSDARY